MAKTQPLELVVGLGNPGPEHARDRHNAGFWMLDRLAEEAGATFRNEHRFNADLARMPSGVRLLKPLTYMNNSGEAVAACARYFRVATEAIVVVHDELDLAAGVVRLKVGGGHGGHNGLRSIDQHLGDSGYARARIGIGRPQHRGAVTSHVLGRPQEQEAELIDAAIEQLVGQMKALERGDFAKVMNALNRR